MTLRAAGLASEERAAWQARLDELKQRNFQLQAELAAGGRKAGGMDAADEEKAAAKAMLEGTGPKPVEATPAAAGPDARSKKDDEFELITALANLPEFQKLVAMQQGGRINEKYAALFKKLRLSPEELARMQTLLAEKQSTTGDVALAVREQGLSGQAARDVARQLVKQSELDLNNSIKQLLGAQRYNQYQTYERTLPQRETVNQLAQRLSYTTTPLTAQQTEQLVQALAARPPADPANPGAAQAFAPVRPLPPSLTNIGLSSVNQAPIAPSAVAKAQTFLSPAQLAALQRMQQEQQAQQMLGNLIRNGSVNPPPKAAPVAPKPKG